MQVTPIAPRRPAQISLTQLRRGPVLSLIGLPELIGLIGAAFLAVITVVAYLYFYLPAQSRLHSAQLERDRLQAVLRASQTNLQQNTTVREEVDKITGSMQDFESNYLSPSGAGRMSLYTTLNSLIKSNGLRNTAGPSYTPLEPIGSKTQIQPSATAERQSNAKWQSIYPGIAVSVTVEGPYQRVRHFVRDIETSHQFLIINAVELEGVTQTGTVPVEIAPAAPTRGSAATAAPTVGGRGTLVSLRLDLATYFQRPQASN